LEGGAWKKEIDCSNEGGRITDIEKLGKILKKGGGVTRIVASRSHMDVRTDEFIKKNYLDKGIEVDLLNVGSSMKIIWIAENKADVYPRLAPTMEWDTCAAHAILRACGGKLELVDKGDELIYNKCNLLNPYFIGSKPLFERGLPPNS
jgi:3'(2'), 5'-bisphosphate nucleotidase